MKNEIHYLTHNEMAEIKQMRQTNTSLFIAEIYGSTIQSIEEYFNIVSEIFKFPIPARGFAGYQDWIRDLDWLNKDGYILIIYDFSKFMERDLHHKNDIITDFEDVILPWWQEEVEKCVVEGRVKPFTVYLVD